MPSILRRPLDLLTVILLLTFLAIAVTIDFAQSFYGSVLALEDIDVGIWPPFPVLQAYAWWCETVDPLLGHNPIWYETLARASPFIYGPFYVVAIYAFLYEKEWIRIPALMWGWGVLLTMSAVVMEQLYGEHSTKNTTLFALAYGGYVLVPVMVMLRVARAPVFPAKHKKD